MHPDFRFTHRRTLTAGAALLALGVALAACNNNSAAEPAFASGVTVVSGNEQYATVGTSAANPLVVLVVDAAGTPFPNAPVTWRVTGGGGVVADSTTTSDASGHARVVYTAGATPGVATVVATVAQIWTASFKVYVVSPSTRVR